jgi:hypothetical protein
MSAKVMGAVMTGGPRKLRQRMVLVAIADNADDFGFAVLSIETIASKAVCEARTAMRMVQALEREDWLRVQRRVTGGKGSVYFINVDRLGLVPDARSRKSEMHQAFARTLKNPFSGDKMSPESKPAAESVLKSLGISCLEEQPEEVAESGDKMSPENGLPAVDIFFVPEKSGDNSQGVQVTKTSESGDILTLPILRNHVNHLNQSTTTPQPPLRGGGVDFESREPRQVNGNGGEPDRKPNGTGDPRKSKPAGDPRKATAGGPCDAVQSECEAAMLECGLSNPRMLRVIVDAMRMQTKRERMSPVEVRLMMVASWKRWKADAGYMRHSIGPRKFFGEGYWLDETLWPVDHARIERERHRAKASIGTRW